MKRLLAVTFLVGLAAGAALAQLPCSCEEPKARAAWCDRHEVGRIAGVEVRSAKLFDALGARGREIEDPTLECESCRRAKDRDGFCTAHERGFVDGLAYPSRLSYHLARGTPRDPERLDCPVCRKNADSHGWCARCGVGMFAHVEIDGRAAFDDVDRAFHVLLEANEKAATCESCAAAMVTDGRCPVCDVVYRHGKPVDEP